ncbi:PucR family transcriptional regulator [Amycolatopsis anabasis]|uniref:PucR family transcriptional regulator n=1 Tax=Amycolatopsis anabasis TaxID=1840409 RepID=UPI00131A7ADC|nr:PucR family transcriptional regulator [Amycolatopsis anabasis]
MNATLLEEPAEARQLWSRMPREVAEQFRPHVETLTKVVLREIEGAVPRLTRSLDRDTGGLVARGIERAVLHCVDTIAAPGGSGPDSGRVFRQLGRNAFTGGHSLDSLQAAYRAGGRAAWRYVSAFGRSTRLPSNVLCLCAEAIFAYIDEISTQTIEGYTEERMRAEDLTADRRRRLLELIIGTPAPSAQSLEALAQAAGWEVPDRITAIAVAPPDGAGAAPAPAMHPDVLLDFGDRGPFLLTARPDRALHDFRLQRPGWRAAVGPRVPLGEAATSLLWARRTLDLVRGGIVADEPVTRYEDHLSTLWLLADQHLLAELTERSLAPLAGLSDNRRARLGETLLAWLQCRGNASDTAAKLGVHLHTVRDRMRRVAALFGDRLDNPDERFVLQLALRADRFRPGDDSVAVA